MLLRPRPADLALTAGFVAFALIEEAVSRMPGRWWPYALALFAVLVLMRRSMPLVAMAVSAAAASPLFYAPEPVTYRLWQLVAMIIAVYTGGRMLPWSLSKQLPWRSVIGAVLVSLTAINYWANDRTDPMAAIFFTGAPYALGLAVAIQTERLAETAAVRASIRERQAREAVVEERVRIARELHDMVAHSVTVMTIQAGVVRRRLDAGLDVDPQLLRTIESSGRDAVGELRRTLGLLRGEGVETAQAPVGLERLDELVGQVREAGLEVTVRRTGEATLPPAADMSAYRIVQEALTNVLKHAGPATATVTVSVRPPGLHLSVVNTGSLAVIADAGGQGLIGMRERAALFGGTLTATPRPGGGFEVHAVLPVAGFQAATSAAGSHPADTPPASSPSAAASPAGPSPSPAAVSPGAASPAASSASPASGDGTLS